MTCFFTWWDIFQQISTWTRNRFPGSGWIWSLNKLRPFMYLFVLLSNHANRSIWSCWNTSVILIWPWLNNKQWIRLRRNLLCVLVFSSLQSIGTNCWRLNNSWPWPRSSRNKWRISTKRHLRKMYFLFYPQK